jgi:hypothetical protein
MCHLKTKLVLLKFRFLKTYEAWLWCNDAHNHTKWLQMVNTWRLHWVKVEGGWGKKFPPPSWMVDGKA